MKIDIFGYTLNIDIAKMTSDNAVPDDLKEALEVIQKYGVRSSASKDQKDAARSASRIKEERTRRAMSEAIHQLLFHSGLNRDQITAYRLSKETGCAYNTAKKYIALWKDGDLHLPVEQDEDEIPFDIPIEED